MEEYCDTCRYFSGQKACDSRFESEVLANKWLHRPNGWCIKLRCATTRKECCPLHHYERQGYFNKPVPPITINNPR